MIEAYQIKIKKAVSGGFKKRTDGKKISIETEAYLNEKLNTDTGSKDFEQLGQGGIKSIKVIKQLSPNNTVVFPSKLINTPSIRNKNLSKDGSKEGFTIDLDDIDSESKNLKSILEDRLKSPVGRFRNPMSNRIIDRILTPNDGLQI